MPTPEFIFLNGQAARITSMKPDPDSSRFTLVLMARGSADRDQLLNLLRGDHLSVRVGDEPERRMTATDLDIRSTGEGPRAIHRIQVTLEPEPGSTLDSEPAPSPEDRLSSIEDRLDEIISLLKDIRDGR